MFQRLECTQFQSVSCALQMMVMLKSKFILRDSSLNFNLIHHMSAFDAMLILLILCSYYFLFSDLPRAGHACSHGRPVSE